MEIFFYRIDNIKINKEILLPDIDFLSAIVDALCESWCDKVSMRNAMEC